MTFVSWTTYGQFRHASVTLPSSFNRSAFNCVGDCELLRCQILSLARSWDKLNVRAVHTINATMLTLHRSDTVAIILRSPTICSVLPPSPSSSPERPVSDWAPTPQKKYVGTRQSAIVEIPEIKSTPAARSTRTNEVLAQRQKNVLPPSSPPGPPSSLSAVASETVILSEAIRIGDHVVNRKVPRPHSPLPPRVTDGLGEVLVPNSDTSLSHSQSQTQSQSQRGQDESKGRSLGLNSVNAIRPVWIPEHHRQVYGAYASDIHGTVRST
ncbi:hypothetical protein BDQ17DRAFT_1329403 [Cyathus striatus]|nr:hypothetical protein BDQ17DRAFT_1329403 [Cyathus striatus]